MSKGIHCIIICLTIILLGSCEKDPSVKAPPIIEQDGENNLVQNLITNPSFEDNEGKESISGWILKGNVDPILFAQDAPVGGGTTALRLAANWFADHAETYVTGQAGTNAYQFSVWAKTDSIGPAPGAKITLGVYSQNIYTSIKEIHYSKSTSWTQYLSTDTIMTLPSDTIAIRFYPGYSQFPLLNISTFYDLVELKKMD
ncbi:MAG: hypothetical protein JKY52_07140 [Flavobacteriales bacterium]|nr:hypothetical protein [Flavobacteriales bacterium]